MQYCAIYDTLTPNSSSHLNYVPVSCSATSAAFLSHSHIGSSQAEEYEVLYSAVSLPEKTNSPVNDAIECPHYSSILESQINDPLYDIPTEDGSTPGMQQSSLTSYRAGQEVLYDVVSEETIIGVKQ